jgi:ketosteroid isomerase-like protein
VRPATRRAASLTAGFATALAACGRADAGAARGAAGPAAADAALADSLAALVTAAYDFSRPGVVDRVLALYPDGGPVVSAASGAVTTSRAALRGEVERFWARVGQNMVGARFEVRERHLARLGPDAAALTFTYQIPHRTPEGRPHTLAGAWTAVFRRERGRWAVVQEHLSDVPRVTPRAAAPGTAGAAPGADTARPAQAHAH